MRAKEQLIVVFASLALGLASCDSRLNSFDASNMVLVQGSSFVMGSDRLTKNELPLHKVSLSDFLIGRTEVTGELYASIMGHDPSYYKGPNLPAECVSWIDAAEFCNKLSKAQGLEPAYLVDQVKRTVFFIEGSKGYRLPTEAEWEFAAQGGTLSKKYTFSGSNDASEVAWDASNSGGRVHEVATKKPNELGLYDMDGNVWEWCYDTYEPYTSADQINPLGSDKNNYKVVRGGNWEWLVAQFGTKYRFVRDFDHRNKNYGFRIARSL